jgi:hypothetical protein
MRKPWGRAADWVEPHIVTSAAIMNDYTAFINSFKKMFEDPRRTLAAPIQLLNLKQSKTKLA